MRLIKKFRLNNVPDFGLALLARHYSSGDCGQTVISSGELNS